MVRKRRKCASNKRIFWLLLQSFLKSQILARKSSLVELSRVRTCKPEPWASFSPRVLNPFHWELLDIYNLLLLLHRRRLCYTFTRCILQDGFNNNNIVLLLLRLLKQMEHYKCSCFEKCSQLSQHIQIWMPNHFTLLVNPKEMLNVPVHAHIDSFLRLVQSNIY